MERGRGESWKERERMIGKRRERRERGRGENKGGRRMEV